MKKTYETPSIEVVKFQYRDQVVVASGDGPCDITRPQVPGTFSCSEDSNPGWNKEQR